MSKKPLLHFKFNPKDIKHEYIAKFADSLKEYLDKDYNILFTPFDLTLPEKMGI